jgi:GTP-binding protein EngB required for normal cell division
MVMPKCQENEICFQQFITDYFETREQLVCAFVLIDIRHEAQAIDIEFMSYMGESEIRFASSLQSRQNQ